MPSILYSDIFGLSLSISIYIICDLLCQRLLPAPSSGGLCSFGSFNPSFDATMDSSRFAENFFHMDKNIKLQACEKENIGKPFNKRDIKTACHESRNKLVGGFMWFQPI